MKKFVAVSAAVAISPDGYLRAELIAAVDEDGRVWKFVQGGVGGASPAPERERDD